MEPEQDNVDLRKYLEILIHWWWVLLIVPAITVGLAYFVLRFDCFTEPVALLAGVCPSWPKGTGCKRKSGQFCFWFPSDIQSLTARRVLA